MLHVVYAPKAQQKSIEQRNGITLTQEISTRAASMSAAKASSQTLLAGTLVSTFREICQQPDSYQDVLRRGKIGRCRGARYVFSEYLTRPRPFNFLFQYLHHQDPKGCGVQLNKFIRWSKMEDMKHIYYRELG